MKQDSILFSLNESELSFLIAKLNIASAQIQGLSVLSENEREKEIKAIDEIILKLTKNATENIQKNNKNPVTTAEKIIL